MAKSKLNLHSYQQDILAKLKEATEGNAAGSASKLGVKVGDANWLIALGDVNEVLPVPTIMPVPLTQSWFMGMTNVRGILYGVSDFSALQGHPRIAITRESRVLIAHQRFDANVGLLVSQLIGLRNVDDMEAQVLTAEMPVWQLGRYKDNQGQVWDELNIGLLLEQQEFMQVAA